MPAMVRSTGGNFGGDVGQTVRNQEDIESGDVAGASSQQANDNNSAAKASPQWAPGERAARTRNKPVAKLECGTTAGQLRKVWTTIANRIRAELGEDLYSSWFARIEPISFEDNVLTLTVPTRFLRNWLTTHYDEKLTAFWAAHLSDLTRLEIGVRSRGTPVAQRGGVDQNNGPNAGAVTEQRAMTAAGARSTPDTGASRSHDMTFENFVVGKSNALAHAAAVRVADASPSSPVSFNPLYIHSASGLGKTHLLHAISKRINEQHPSRRVVYLTAERFMYRFTAAVRARDTLAFKDHFQGVDVLLIDDFQFLQGQATRREFCYTINSLIDTRRQVIVAADLPPLQLDDIDEHLRSRLAGGLVIDIEPADFELRRKILQARLIDMQKSDPRVDIPDDVLDFVAHRVQGGGRGLEGALARLTLDCARGDVELSVDSASRSLRDLLHAGDLRQIKIDDIQRVVGKHYNVTRADLLSPRRARSIVRPRQVGMFLSKRLTARSLPEIGRRFGGRDHSTVLHGIRKIQELLAKDEKLAREVDLLIRLLEN